MKYSREESSIHTRESFHCTVSVCTVSVVETEKLIWMQKNENLDIFLDLTQFAQCDYIFGSW